MPNQSNTSSSLHSDPQIDDLARSFHAVGVLIAQVRHEQWSAPTPCTEWTVRALVDHLIGMNRVFIALIAGHTPPQRQAVDHVEHDPVGAYRDTAAALLAAFTAPGVLDREYQGPLGPASGAERLQIRLYDLLAHGWDLARATGQRAELPDDVADRSLAFARTQVSEQARPGRFDPAQTVDGHASGIERLVAFLGRPVDATAATHPTNERLVLPRLRRGIAIRVREDTCEILIDGRLRSARYAPRFPSPRTERVSPGHLVAVATAPDGSEVLVWRWYDAVVLGQQDKLIKLWEPAHGEVLAHQRPTYVPAPPGTRAYLSAGLPGAEWWVTGQAAAAAENADVELDEVERLYTEHNLWDDLV